MDYRYTYLILCSVFFVFWLFLFISRKDTRKEMIFMSILFALIGIPAEIIYIRDWWHPEFILGSIWIESIFMGFVLGGIFSVIYEEILRKNIRIPDKSRPARPWRLIIICALSAFLFVFLTFSLHLNSLITTIIAVGIPLVIIFAERSDLLVQGLATALMALILASITYSITNLITPGWAREFFYFYNTPAIIIGNVPVDDIIWYIFAGMFIGPLYAYWQEGRLVSKPAANSG